MPEIINLPEDDPRVGKYNADGTFASWPAVNLDGGRYEQQNAIVLRTGHHFVVLPPLRTEPVEVKVGGLVQATGPLDFSGEIKLDDLPQSPPEPPPPGLSRGSKYKEA